nr:conotoxin precursor Q [Conus ebraeus]DAZ86263.1 TPA_inf: conotoxin precursor Q [Conus ebraeus]
MSKLGMMLLILLLLLPLAAFDGDRPTIRGQRSAKFLKSVIKRSCVKETPCASNKWCCENCCSSSDCECDFVGPNHMKSFVCVC